MVLPVLDRVRIIELFIESKEATYRDHPIAVPLPDDGGAGQQLVFKTRST